MARMKLDRNIVIWFGVIAFSVVLAITAVLYFQVMQVPVLTRDVVAGTQITPDMYKLVQVNPRDQLLGEIVTNPSELFKDGNPSGTNGKYALSTMVAGQPIPKRLVTANPLDPQFGVGSEVQQGEVAISAAVDIADAIGGMVDKGNIVNVSFVPLASGIGESLGGSSRFDLAKARTIQRVRVLDVRSENGMPRYSSGVGAAGGSVTSSRTLIVTLAIPASEAERFSVAAATGGRVSLALPSRLDGGEPGTVVIPDSEEQTGTVR